MGPTTYMVPPTYGGFRQFQVNVDEKFLIKQ